MISGSNLTGELLIHAVYQDAEKSFKKTLEVDQLIDMLGDSTAGEVSGSVSTFIFGLCYK